MEDSFDATSEQTDEVQSPQVGDSRRAGLLRLQRIIAGNGPLICAVAGAMLLFYVMGMRKGPTNASAAPSSAEMKVEAILSAMKQGAKAEKANSDLVDSMFHQATESQIPLKELLTNPFVFEPPEGSLPPLPPEPVIEEPEPSPQQEEAMEAVANLKLQSVLTGSGGAMAMINNNLLTKGQKINGWTVSEIHEREVVLTWRNQRRLLKMSR